VKISRKVISLAAVASLAVAMPLVSNYGASASTTTPQASGTFTAAQVLAGVKKNMTNSKKVNSKPHINTMTRAKNVNVYQVASGVFAYTSSMAIDDDGSDPNPDPDHQNQTTFKTSDGKYLGAAHVPFYVLGDDCWDRKSPCPHFFYKEHNIKGRQFALMFYKSKCIGAIFGDTQTGNSQTTSNNDSRELGEASVKSAKLLGIPSSGTTGGVDNGVTVVIFSGPSWVVNGTNSTLNNNAQAMVQKALNSLGTSMGL
jgi:glycosyl hydrolase group 75 (putative chitosanase)